MEVENLRDCKVAYLTEMQRGYNRKRAAQEMDHEKAIRTNQMKLDHVMCELVRRANQLHAARSADRERAERVAVTSLRQQIETAVSLAKIHEELVRSLNQRDARKAASEEKARRIAENIRFDVMVQLERHMNQRRAARMMDEEKQERVSARAKSCLMEQMKSRFASNVARQLEEQERQRRITEYPTLQSAMDAIRTRFPPRDEIHERLQRLARQREVLVEMEHEQERRIQCERMANTLTDLIRQTNQRWADEAAEKERAERVWARRYDEAMQQLSRYSNQRAVSALVQLEQNQRCHESKCLGKSGLLELTVPRLAELHEEFERSNNQRVAVESMERERERRITVMKMCQVLTELVRHINQRLAVVAMEQERQRRISESLKRKVMHQLARKCVQKQVAIAVELERKRLSRLVRDTQRIDSSAEKENVQTRIGANTPGFTGHSKENVNNIELVRRAKCSVHNQLTKRIVMRNIGNGIRERANVRALRECKDQVVNQLQRNYNQKKADRAMDNEKLERVSMLKYDQVLEEMKRRNTLHQVLKDVENERKQQMIVHEHLGHGIYLGRAAWDQVHEQVRSAVSRRSTIEQEEGERQVRIVRQIKDSVLSDLTRCLNRAKAAKEMDDEQQRRVAQDNFGFVCTEMERMFAQRQAWSDCDEEQKRRIKERSNNYHTEFDELFDRVHESLLRVFAIKKVTNAMELERKRRMYMNSFSTVMQQLVRTYNQNIADALCNAEQQRRVAVDCMGQVVVQLQRQFQQQQAWACASIEQERRVKQQTSMDIETLKWILHSHPRYIVQEQLLRFTSGKEADQAMNSEQKRRVAMERYSKLVLEQLLKRTAQIQVWKMCCQEQSERIIQKHKECVVAELTRNFNILNVMELAEKERQRRTSNTNEQIRVMRIQLGVSGLANELPCAAQAMSERIVVESALSPSVSTYTAQGSSVDGMFECDSSERSHRTVPSGEWVVLEDEM